VAVPEQALSGDNATGAVPAPSDGAGFFASSGVRKAVLLARYTDLLHDW
jgi:hypothetical protein